MAKDKYYFEIDGEKVLELTPTKVPEYKHEVDMMPTGSYEDPYLVFSNSELYKTMKEKNMIDENDKYLGIGGWYKFIVQDIEGEYTFGVEKN